MCDQEIAGIKERIRRGLAILCLNMRRSFRPPVSKRSTRIPKTGSFCISALRNRMIARRALYSKS
ncbi:MAG: hypothetical protein DME99_06410 [Verrucomicrobia bacterium]|nr:MAG: hypothetical protein DME99_06410 [Verrucomicrobiota bacterium]